jgi:uncharacterized protein YukE
MDNINHAISLDVLLLASLTDRNEVLTLITNIGKAFPEASGLIIASVERGTGKLQEYWDGDSFLSFADPTRAEYPKIYRTTRRLLKAVEKIQKEYPKAWISPAFWWHPDVGPRLERYLKMTGHQFPGTPRL